jgi:XTP/dITP diphosphohydrolase
MDDLREKCPKQTIQTLRHMTIEETYELTDKSRKKVEWHQGRTWRLLLHIVFYSKIVEKINLPLKK